MPLERVVESFAFRRGASATPRGKCNSIERTPGAPQSLRGRKTESKGFSLLIE